LAYPRPAAEASPALGGFPESPVAKKAAAGRLRHNENVISKQRMPPADGWKRLMSLTKERKHELIGAYGRGKADTGSAEVQIALLTGRISHLTDHFKKHSKDFASRRGLLMMVSRRRRLLDYLKRVAPQRYLDIIKRLEIRK
jgi:small subunit ribosomal protein S15